MKEHGIHIVHYPFLDEWIVASKRYKCISAIVAFKRYKCISAIVAFKRYKCISAIIAFKRYKCISAIVAFKRYKCISAIVAFKRYKCISAIIAFKRYKCIIASKRWKSTTFCAHFGIVQHYSDNKFVLLINAPVDGMIEATTFVAKSTNGTDHSQQNFALFLAAPPNIVCKWTNYMAVFDSVENPKSLEIGFGSNSVPVEFQLPYLKKRVQVGTCFSPIFFAENWQLVVLAIEIYRHYGIKLQYAAEFLIVGDVDDILVPDHGNYYEEFIRNDYRHKKNAVALLYVRYTVDITRKAANFSLFDALTTAKVAMYQPDDPKYVVNTSRAESLWIHWPYKIKPNTATRLVPSTEGRMLHFRNWHYSDDNGNSTGNYMHMNVIKIKFRKILFCGGPWH
uniref:Glycosyltransferase family 92 protein n=1 Tax=Globodera rostochiensis TaxID=31243 RepID=A0A914H8D9_GLORO